MSLFHVFQEQNLLKPPVLEATAAQNSYGRRASDGGANMYLHLQQFQKQFLCGQTSHPGNVDTAGQVGHIDQISVSNSGRITESNLATILATELQIWE